MKRLPVFLLTSLLSLPLAANPLGFALPQNLPTMVQHILTVINRIDGDIYEKTGGQGTAHIFAGGQRIASKTGDAVLYFHQDHLGSTSLVTDMAGAVVQTTRYMPFGNIYSSNGSLTDVGFTGHRHDFSDGLIYMKARYYDPAIGRFVSPDTLVQSPYDPQTLNRYAYARNNPVLYTDPSGYSFSLNRTINSIGKELKRINQTMYRQWHRWDDQLNRLQEKNPNFNFSGGYGITLGGNDRDSFTGEIRYHPYNKPYRPEPNNPVSTLLVDVSKEISNNAYSRPGAGLLAEAGMGDYHSKAEEWALRVAEWSEATSYVANGVAMGSLLFGPEATPVYGGASLVAAGLDITATAGYWTHYSLSNQKASLFKGFSSFLSVPLDAVPMFKPGISVTRIGGAVSYMERFGSRSGFIAYSTAN
ncbi:MAG: RHS repeat-associated core domain-containing protein [Elusimicrobia bacterium]|nr:RHS repeat-associated core domain-containing protein [Elusimicrobiota bacterium]